MIFSQNFIYYKSYHSYCFQYLNIYKDKSCFKVCANNNKQQNRSRYSDNLRNRIGNETQSYNYDKKPKSDILFDDEDQIQKANVNQQQKIDQDLYDQLSQEDKYKLRSGTDIDLSKEKLWYNPLNAGTNTSHIKDYQPITNLSDDFENPANKLFGMTDFTEQANPAAMQQYKEMAVVDKAFKSYFNLDQVPPAMERDEIESVICHVGLEGVPRNIPIPLELMATLFNDEDIEEVNRVIGNHKRRFVPADELLGPKHMGFPIQSYFDEDFQTDMTAVLGPSERMLNFGDYVKVRAQKAKVAEEIPPQGFEVRQLKRGMDPDAYGLEPMSHFREGDIVEGNVMQIHAYSGVAVNFGCDIQGLIPVQYPSWFDQGFDWINGISPLKLRISIGMKVQCRIYRIWEPQYIWRFPIQLEILDPFLKDFVTKPELWINPINWGQLPDEQTREIVENTYGFAMETPQERYPEEERLILTYNDWEPEWVKQRKFEQTELGFLWGTAPSQLRKPFKKKPEQMTEQEMAEVGGQELRERLDYEAQRPKREIYGQDAALRGKLAENMHRQMMQMRANDDRSYFK